MRKRSRWQPWLSDWQSALDRFVSYQTKLHCFFEKYFPPQVACCLYKLMSKIDCSAVMTDLEHTVQFTCQIKLCGYSSLSQHSFTKHRNINRFIACRVWKCFGEQCHTRSLILNDTVSYLFHKQNQLKAKWNVTLIVAGLPCRRTKRSHQTLWLASFTK